MSTPADAFNRALSHHQSGDLVMAENGYRLILKQAPRDITVLYHLGIVLHQQAKPKEARKYLAKALKNAPDFVEARLSLAIVLMELGQNDEAEVAFRRIISLRPDMENALLRLGELLILKKKYSEAIPLLRKSIQLSNNNVKPWAALVEALRHLNLPEDAIEANKRALELENSENNHSQMATLIYLLYRQNQKLARKHAQDWIDAYPKSTFAQHIGSAILGLPAPIRASNSYVTNLFDNFAKTFEEQLAKVDYNLPEIIATIADLNDSTNDLVILDAGCGTGWAAASLKPAARRLIGVDISPRMLEQAQKKGLYDELVEMELGDFLKSNTASFDLIVATDVFNYFGNLEQIVEYASQSLLPGGKLVFSVECNDENNTFILGPHGRYSHNKIYVGEIIKEAKLELHKMQDVELRKEFGNTVNGFLVLATKLL
jgi:predicted TPR repeat methyltransferase